MKEYIAMFADGASRGNPGEAAIGVFCQRGLEPVNLAEYKNEKKNEIFSISRRIGVTTNNVAEYQALIDGLSECQKQNIRPDKVFLDSELVVKQIKGEYKIKDAKMKAKFLEVLPLLNSLKPEIIHIKREKNSIADFLANEAYNN